MPENHNTPLSKEPIHGDAWWFRALEGSLTPEQQRLWEQHLQTCDRCRLEWEAVQQVDLWLEGVKAEAKTLSPPALSSAFTDKAVRRIRQRQRLRRLLGFLAGTLIVVVVSVLVLGQVSSAVASLEYGLSAAFTARQTLFNSFVNIMVNLIAAWREALPFLVGLALLTFLLLMPNGLIATLVIFWLAKRNQTRPAYASVQESQQLEVG
jgi:predicted anti-sigma-YlaC factor YlaD